MKTKKKLALNKKTVANLNRRHMKIIQAGEYSVYPDYCDTEECPVEESLGGNSCNYSCDRQTCDWCTVSCPGESICYSCPC